MNVDCLNISRSAARAAASCVLDSSRDDRMLFAPNFHLLSRKVRPLIFPVAAYASGSSSCNHTYHVSKRCSVFQNTNHRIDIFTTSTFHNAD
jgi:hypothetical protein